jgi:hypothetical protein
MTLLRLANGGLKRKSRRKKNSLETEASKLLFENELF